MALLPCVNLGFTADDAMLRVRASGDHRFAGFPPTRSDLFVFISGDPAQRAELMETGTLPWWTAPYYRLAFWRPISSWTHAADFAWWPDQSAAMYLHSIAWFAVALAIVAALYRRHHSRAVATLALLLFALDDARGPAVGYISNRNAVLALAFGAAALVAHDRWRRDGQCAAAVLAPLAFACGLLAGEATIGVLGYLLGHAVFLDRGSILDRARALAPYALVLVAYAAGYRALGYGATGSDIYVDPGGDPRTFATLALPRIAALLAGQFAGPWSDFWLVYSPEVAIWVLVWSVAVVVTVAAVMRRSIGGDPVARMWATGSLVACVPIASAFPADRLLGFVGLGGMGLVAMLFDAWYRAGARGRRWSAGARVVVGVLALCHLVLAPLLLPVRARSMETVSATLRLFDDALGRDAEVASVHALAILTPNEGMLSYLPVTRAAEGVPAPRSVRALTSSTGAIEVTRTAEHTLEVVAVGGLLSSPSERMVRSLRQPFHVGERFAMGVRDPVGEVEVLALTDDGRPARTRFTFVQPLEHPSHRWLRWDVLGFVPWTPPALGTKERIEGFDLGESLSALER